MTQNTVHTAHLREHKK